MYINFNVTSNFGDHALRKSSRGVLKLQWEDIAGLECSMLPIDIQYGSMQVAVHES
jgi:hypothetical protein